MTTWATVLIWYASISGYVYQQDGITPALGTGGRDWWIVAADTRGNTDGISVTYDGSSYVVTIDRSKVSGRINLQLHAGPGRLDTAIENIASNRHQTIDLCFER